MPTHWWLRAETKPGEARSPMLPRHAAALLARGDKVTVEQSPQRFLSDSEFSAISGVTLVKEHAWQSLQSDSNVVVIGLKEPSMDFLGVAARHDHVCFAHCYKGQDGWKEALGPHAKGKEAHGTHLFDLEFLLDTATGRRVAAFGKFAGFVGAALGVASWASGGGLADLVPFADRQAIVAWTQEHVGKSSGGKMPRVCVLGAKGRCGSGAVDMLRTLGVADADLALWDIEETQGGGPFEALLDFDVLINCIYLAEPIPPFIDSALLDKKGTARRLTTIVDVSCDPSSPHNPLPIYNRLTHFQKPAVRVVEGNSAGLLPLDVIAIDHLPTLLPRESSDEFADALFPHLQEFPQSGTWEGARKIFLQRSSELHSETAP